MADGFMNIEANLSGDFPGDRDEIAPAEEAWIREARSHLDSLTKPIGSLGHLEDIAATIVAIQQSHRPSVEKKAVFVFAADHGITMEGVSAYPKAVTEQMVLNFLRGGAAINVLAHAVSAEVHVVDVGVDATLDHAGLISRKIRRGTRNFLHAPAMSGEELKAAMDVGIRLATEASSRGIQLAAVGEMGIGNTTAASAITAALTGQPAERVTGAGTGVTGAVFDHKVRVVADALAFHFPHYTEELPAALEILRCLGGLEIAAICGFVLSAAKHRITVVIDGFISTAAAAIACMLRPAVRDYLVAGHASQEIGHTWLLDFIGIAALLNLQMRLGEGTGAVLAFSIIDAAVRIYTEMATFHSAGVSGAIQQ
jgi:nicotinate-nucleotide--dimethylbenzimidazole phosphoribosyltransferase